jgi:hypothetical protein
MIGARDTFFKALKPDPETQCARVAGLCENMKINVAINKSKAAEAEERLKSRPPLPKGLSRKSPTTAPSGRVSMNAAQNSTVWEILVR